MKLSILPMNDQCDLPLQNYYGDFACNGDMQLVTNRFDKNAYCTVSGGNFLYSFRFLRIEAYNLIQPLMFKLH